jgi:hypothetical protein
VGAGGLRRSKADLGGGGIQDLIKNKLCLFAMYPARMKATLSNPIVNIPENVNISLKIIM